MVWGWPAKTINYCSTLREARKSCRKSNKTMRFCGAGLLSNLVKALRLSMTVQTKIKITTRIKPIRNSCRS